MKVFGYLLMTLVTMGFASVPHPMFYEYPELMLVGIFFR